MASEPARVGWIDNVIAFAIIGGAFLFVCVFALLLYSCVHTAGVEDDLLPLVERVGTFPKEVVEGSGKLSGERAELRRNDEGEYEIYGSFLFTSAEEIDYVIVVHRYVHARQSYRVIGEKARTTPLGQRTVTWTSQGLWAWIIDTKTDEIVRAQFFIPDPLPEFGTTRDHPGVPWYKFNGWLREVFE